MLGIYCRTSKSRVDKYTIENQREGGMKCATTLGLGFRVYIDDGISGTLDESVRDGLSDLFRDIKNEEITHVYCIDQSRIERDTRTWEFFVAVCLNNNVKYFPGGSYFDLDSPTNMMFAKLMSVVNAYYSEITSKKVRLANARKVKAGKTHGLKPYGYKRDDKNDFAVYEPEAKNVRLMFSLSLTGLGTYSIANHFNEKSIPTKFSGNFKGSIKRKNKYNKQVVYFEKSKMRWRGNVIYDIIKNEIYKGVRIWNRHEDKMELIDGKLVRKKIIAERIVSTAPIIVEPDIWDKVNRNLINNKKNVGKKAQYRYLLNDLIICADCGRYFVGKKRLANGDNAYKCKGKIYPHPECSSSRGISINKLDSFIVKHLFHSKSLKDKLLKIQDKPSLRSGLQNRIYSERKKLKGLDADLRVGYKRLLSPKFENDRYVENEVEILKNSIDKQKKLVDDLEKDLVLTEANARKKRTRELIGSYIDNIDFDDLKKLVHSLIDWIKIEHQKPEGMMGDFIMEIKYNGYEETSRFLTNWQANKWHWLSHYRAKATNRIELDEDRNTMQDLLEYYGIKVTQKTLKEFKQKSGLSDEEINKMNPMSDKFEGMEISRGIHETIILERSDIVYFD